MIHARQSVRRGLTAQVCVRRRAFPGLRAGVCALASVGLWLGAASCDGNGIQPDNLRYGQVGSIQVVLEAPLHEAMAPLQLNVGRLRQTLEWGSSGAWTLQEVISYKGQVGDEDFRRNPGEASQYALDYFQVITQLNEVGPQKIVDFPDLSPEPDTIPDACGVTYTRITFTIRDDARNDSTTWIRCAQGSLGNLATANAGPDAAAARIAQAVIVARNGTLGEGFSSVYAGSVPFATLARGTNLTTADRSSVVLTDSASFRSFWGQAGGGKPQPSVDFAKEMVVLGVVGERDEAGDSVEVRRIVQVNQGSLIEVWERIPGDYCSPVARTHVPYHLVVSPRTEGPLRFAEAQKVVIPCGG
jgi:hypothetical protein